MKAKYILLVIALASVFGACRREEKDLFDDSAAVRAQKALDNARDVLTAPANGWEMLYFPNPESGGYSVLIKFDAKGNVFVASRNPQTTANKYMTDGNSTWVVVSDYGPILSFDTYNNVMHKWADPDPNPNSRNTDYERGDGYLGDYEFLILEATPEKVRLKGKKHGAYCILYPLKVGLDWIEYFNQVYVYRDLLVTGNDGTAFKYTTPGSEKKVVYNAGRMDEDYERGLIYPFVIRPNLVTFYNTGMPAQGGNAINFKINSEMTALECVDNGISARFESAMTIAEILNAKLDNHIQWTIDKKDMGESSKAAYDVIANALKSSGGSLRKITIQRIDSTYQDPEAEGEPEVVTKIDRINIEFNGSNGLTQAFFVMDFTLNGTQLSYSYKYPSGEDKNPMYASEFLQRAGGGVGKEDVGLERLKALITGEFNVTSASGSTLNAKQLYLIGTNDSNKRIKISAQ